MNDDDQLCLCFHVSKRKVIQYIRAEKPKIASQLADCYGAGTGCGWCRPFLTRLLLDAQQSDADLSTVELPDSAEYARQRSDFRESKK